MSDSEQGARTEAAADRLRIDAATVEVMRAFADGGIRCLLLKGPALASWYADDLTRSYLDCDLWVRPRDLDSAAPILERLGFERHLDDRAMPAWWLDHATIWLRVTDGVVVDVHRALQGLGVDADTAWTILTATIEILTVAGAPVPTLAVPARALYVTLHAAHHGRGGGKAITHLERALSAEDDSVWRRASELAEELQATDPFGSGLRLTSAGASLAKRLGLPATQSVKVALHAASPPPIALGFEQLASAPGWRARAGIVRHKLFPPPAFIRHWAPRAAENRGQLALAYMRRPFWVLRRAPRGLKAWLDARRRVRRGH
ncbi:MAG: nucleotidyltransferase family protein [Solirubrobacteraceae bacterium]